MDDVQVSDMRGAAVRLDPFAGLDELVRVLLDDGFRVVGPQWRDGTIVYDDLAAGDDLPVGVTVRQAPGRWRAERTASRVRFAWTPAADSWKRFVTPARQEVVRIRRVDGTFVATYPAAPDRPLAVIGARDCEVRALSVLDTVLTGAATDGTVSGDAPVGQHPNPRYAARRDGMFIVAVTCGAPADTCWCTSMGGGPEPQHGFDLRITELDDGDGHRLLAEPGSERGAAVLVRLAGSSATDSDAAAAAGVTRAALTTLGVRVPGTELPGLLAGCDGHEYWDEVAERCLACGNCTMVCPTCFCSTFRDTTALTDDGSPADESIRVQEWASCFQADHSLLGGHPVRSTTAHRYRQWLTHKLQTWQAQFGTPGCVGCGRCTTWCPAGIDLAAEANTLIAARQAGVPS